MASELKIFRIYNVQNKNHYYLLQTERPGYSNASQIQENRAYEIEQHKRNAILDLIGKNYDQNCKVDFECIGEFQDYPIGDKLYTDHGIPELDIYYMETESGWPWIILGTAASEAEFLSKLNDDEDLVRLQPVGHPKQLKVTFVTEKDFDLSEIEDFDTTDLR